MANATIYDVAGAARVSLATVSRVLNNPEKVNPETRKRVLEVIKQLGYRPNAIARGLASRKTTTVGVIVSDITRASVSQMIHGIMTIAKQFNYSIKVFSMNDEPSIDDFIRSVVSEQVDGVIFLNDELDNNQMHRIKEMFNDSNTPFVLSNVVSEDENIPAVNIDFETAAYEITKQMLSAGRKDIYLFSTVRRYSANNRKEAGYTKAMEEAGLEPKIFRTSGDPDINSLHFNEFFNNHKVDGVISVRDSIAVSFMNIAQKNGHKIPEDILVVGFQNTKYAQLSRPTLTCVDTPVYDLGAAAMELLTKYMKGEEVEETKVVLSYNVFYRDSMKK
jgi:LacI family transcriptional regulator